MAAQLHREHYPQRNSLTIRNWLFSRNPSPSSLEWLWNREKQPLLRGETIVLQCDQVEVFTRGCTLPLYGTLYCSNYQIIWYPQSPDYAYPLFIPFASIQDYNKVGGKTSSKYKLELLLWDARQISMSFYLCKDFRRKVMEHISHFKYSLSRGLFCWNQSNERVLSHNADTASTNSHNNAVSPNNDDNNANSPSKHKSSSNKNLQSNMSTSSSQCIKTSNPKSKSSSSSPSISKQSLSSLSKSVSLPSISTLSNSSNNDDSDGNTKEKISPQSHSSSRIRKKKKRSTKLHLSHSFSSNDCHLQYQPSLSSKWWVFDVRKEYERVGLVSRIAETSKDKKGGNKKDQDKNDGKWRISSINEKYDFSPTYPSLLVVPTTISDDLLRTSALFRSKSRVPVATWRHPNGAVLCRSSQPAVGISSSSREDEELLESIRHSGADDGGSLLVVDPRPKIAAVANRGLGFGYEGKQYQNTTLSFGDIPNIHVMRSSFKQFRDIVASSPVDFYSQLERCGWLMYIRNLLDVAKGASEAIERGTSILVHCSDGWDRTPQVLTLTQLLLDPYYRTLEGFAVMIQHQWLSFGHKFDSRLGRIRLNSTIQNGSREVDGNNDIDNDNDNDMVEKEENVDMDNNVSANEDESKMNSSSDVGEGLSKIKRNERSPVFLQWIECVWQILRQCPNSFEFNSHFLISLIDHSHSCRFGTFLGDNEVVCKERIEAQVHSHTPCYWEWADKNIALFINPSYIPPTSSALSSSTNTSSSASATSKSAYTLPPALYPYVDTSARSIHLWEEFYNRWNWSNGDVMNAAKEQQRLEEQKKKKISGKDKTKD